MILPFDKISKNDANKAGGKGASLGEMTQAGIAIPPGFVVLAETFEEFVDSNNLRAEIQTILGELDHNNVGSIEHASEKIQELIRGGIISEKIQKEIQKYTKTIKTDFVAVRSSATAEDGAEHAWAGQLDTYLNVPKTDIITRIQSCWASLFTPRALFYRSEKGLGDLHISVAVVVQSMVDAESAGVAFSVHPVTENTDEIVIEGSWGLGEAVVSGEVTPDSFVISKSLGEIISEHIAEKKKGIFRNIHGENEWRDIENRVQEKPILTKKELSELSQLIIKIENHYEFPCDIEWAHSKGRIYILQARPITTLKNIHPKKTILTESFTREFSLIQIQMWGRRYTKKFLETKIKSLPIYVFKYRDGLVTAYRSEENQKILINPIIRKKINQDTKFLQKYYEKQVNNIKNIQIILQKKSINTLDLKKYLQKLYDFWQLHYITQFLPLDFNLFTEDERNYALKIRSKIDKKIHYLWGGIEILCKKIYPEMNDLVRWLTWDEVTIGPLPSIDELENRKKIGVILYNDRLVDEKELDILKIKYSFEIQDRNLGNRVTGEIASHGKIQGIVKVIMKKKDLPNFKKDEVFVSYMTMPNFESAYSQACAIVTDEGGITCHAAIISRELKIPCIIGTKNATKILKDGDLVEVDAENGVVKILERKENISWAFTYDRQMSYQRIDLFHYGYCERLSQYFDVKIENELYRIKDGLVSVFYDEPGHKKAFEKIRNLLTGEERAKWYKKIYKTITQDYKEFISFLDKGEKKHPKNKPSHTLREYMSHNRKISLSTWLLYSYIEEILSDVFQKILQQKGIKNWKEIFHTLSQPDEMLPSDEWEYDAAHTAILAKEKQPERIKKLALKYRSYGMYDVMFHGKSQKDIEKKVEETTRESAKQIVENIEKKYKQQRKELEKIKNIKWSKDEKSLLKLYRLYANFKDWKNFHRERSSYQIREIYSEIAEKYPVVEEEILYYMREDDILTGIEKNKWLPKKDILRRKENSALLFLRNREENITDISKLEELDKQTSIHKNSITGVTAYPGKVTGKARIINSHEDLKKLRKGEIMISSTTRPDYLPFMQDVGGFITNEGGVLSHAAILAREIKKPCIIGTKVATQAIKTGDTIYLDGERGIVDLLS